MYQFSFGAQPAIIKIDKLNRYINGSYELTNSLVRKTEILSSCTKACISAPSVGPRCYRGFRNGAEGAEGGSLKSADYNWRSRPQRGLSVGGVASQHAPMLVVDPEPTTQRQKLATPMRQRPGAKTVTRVSREKSKRVIAAGVVQAGNAKTSGYFT